MHPSRAPSGNPGAIHTKVDLNGVVTIGGAPYVMARFRGAIAGESLGMGCFTGQKAAGPMAKLAPPSARG